MTVAADHFEQLDSDQLFEAAREASLNGQVDEFDTWLTDGINAHTEPVLRGELYLARALLNQGQTDCRLPAEDGITAWQILRRTDAKGSAAYASTVAAGLLQRCGRAAEAVDFAAHAMVVLQEAEIAPHTASRIANALAIVFGQLSAFEIAIDLAERAFRGVQALPSPGPAGEIACLTVTHLTVDAIHLVDDPPSRWLDLTREVNEWMRANASTPVGRKVLSPGIELEHAQLIDDIDTVRRVLDSGIGAPDRACAAKAARVVAWFDLVRGCAYSRLGEYHTALQLLDRAIPDLSRSHDRRRSARALRERVLVRRAIGDLEGACDDALALADRARRSQVAEVGRVASQITHRVELERTRDVLSERVERAEMEAAIDSLTGVATRRELERHLEELTLEQRSGAALMFDLDRFKAINDDLGHRFGDVVLQRFGALLQATVVDDDWVAARYGGDEFVVIAADADEQAARSYAELVCARLSDESWDEAPGLTVTCSAGVSIGSLADGVAMLGRADAALYDAKRSGRDQVVVADAGRAAMSYAPPQRRR